jgi:prolipoprotein diacylglyceryltransferase
VTLLSFPARLFAPDSPAGVAYAATPEVRVWATQPIEGVLVVGIAFLCEWLYRRRVVLGLREGAVFAACVGVYGLVRALLELVRADSPRVAFGVFTAWQVLGVTSFVMAVAWSRLPRPMEGSP